MEDALLHGHHRPVESGRAVRIIMDARANPSYPQNAAILRTFADAKIPMREKTSAGIVHWKTMIFAGQPVVEFSGANFSPHAFVPTTPYQDYIDEAIYITDARSVLLCVLHHDVRPEMAEWRRSR